MAVARSRHRGLTLVELLVVMAIVGILAAILLPLIQQAREAARRAKCKVHLKQLGIALHAYHDQYRRFPPGSDNEWSWSARLLPQLEQSMVFKRFDFRVEPFEDPNTDHLGLVVPVLLCPSDRRSEEVHVATSLGGIEFGHTNYLGSLEGGESRGMFGFRDGTRFAEVTDGTSQTLFVGERGIVSDGLDTYGWWTWGSGTTVSAMQGFQEGRFEDPTSMVHWWSYHPGGAQFLFVDGSVHFLSYSIDEQTFLSLGTKDADDRVGSF